MKRSMTVAILTLILALGAAAGEAPPTNATSATIAPGATEISQALERGKNVRIQRGLVPEALMKVAVLLNAGDVRCGFTMVRIEDARGEGGATYKLIEQIKGAVPRGQDMEVIEYSGSLLLDADLALMGGSQVTTKTVTSAKTMEKETVSAEITVRNGELSWVRKEKRADDPEFIEKPEPVKLHGVRPIPHNALICLAAFAAKEPGFKAGVSSPFCVPSLDTGGTIDTFLIQPVWLETDAPRDKKNPDAKLIFRLKIMDGELNEKGMSVDPPNAEGWSDALEWIFNANFKVVSLPISVESLIKSELVDADKLDPKAPLDFVKIKAAMKALEATIRKPDDRITPLPPK